MNGVKCLMLNFWYVIMDRRDWDDFESIICLIILLVGVLCLSKWIVLSVIIWHIIWSNWW
jgi:hypothetical protein